MQHLRLSELCHLVDDALRQAFAERAYWVLAEIKERNDKGEIIYFELIEKAPEGNEIVARMKASVWRREAIMAFRNFEDVTGKRPDKGMLVLVRASVNFHAVHGFSLQLSDIDSRHMLGQLELQRRKTIALLAEKPGMRLVDGVFETPNKKLRLPPVIQRIAIITSASAAGYQDFRHTLEQNIFGYKFSCTPYFSILQGVNAAEEMKKQLIGIYNDCREKNCEYDVVVMIRGGGAQSDLLPFDDLNLAHAVARFPVPVITGVGHLKDESIVDMVAHTKTKTPTEAAKFIIDNNQEYEEIIAGLRELIVLRTNNLIAKHHRKIDHAGAILTNGTMQLLSITENRIARLRDRIGSSAQKNLQAAAQRLSETRRNLFPLTRRLLEKQLHQLDLLTERMRLLKPENVLNRGYAMISKGEKLIVSAKQLEVSEEITIHMHDGKLLSVIKGKQE
jgi:exodeoxyribonuclease VII large subunit